MSWFMLVWTAIGLFPLAWAVILTTEMTSSWQILRRKNRSPSSSVSPFRGSYVILIPAHNESDVIGQTIQDLRQLVSANGRILVVADNCADNTACIARECGVEVVERKDPSKKGKGYALDCGIRALELAPPEAVVILDADCSFDRGTPSELAGLAHYSGAPIQCRYIMRTRGDETAAQRISHFAWRVKNHLRPLGLSGMGLPCHLAGTGMAFPWPVIHSAELASSNIVEDLALGIAMTRKELFPRYKPDIQISSEFPQNPSALNSQRLRWEHGHIQTILSEVPRLLLSALAKRDFRLLATALDVSVPPLSMLALTVGIYGTIGLVGFVFLETASALLMAVLMIALLATAVAMAWKLSAEDLLTFREVIGALLHLPRKVSIYTSFFTGRQQEWIRTDRK